MAQSSWSEMNSGLEYDTVAFTPVNTSRALFKMSTTRTTMENEIYLVC
jgi:hypothetical protein